MGDGLLELHYYDTAYSAQRPIVDSKNPAAIAVGATSKTAPETIASFSNHSELVRLLATHRWLDKPFGIAEEPLFASRLHLEALLTFIGKDLANVDEAELAGLPIVCDEAERLYRGSSLVYRHSDQGERRALGLLGLAFVHPELVTNPAAWEVYQKAGVGDLDLALLGALARLGAQTDQAFCRTVDESIPLGKMVNRAYLRKGR